MLDQQMIGPNDYAAADLASMPDPKRVHLLKLDGPAPYFAEYVKQQLIDRYGSGKVFCFDVSGTIKNAVASARLDAGNFYLVSTASPTPDWLCGEGYRDAAVIVVNQVLDAANAPTYAIDVAFN